MQLLLARMLARVTVEVSSDGGGDHHRLSPHIFTGPLVTKESTGFYTLIGLMSWGLGCALVWLVRYSLLW